MTVEQIKELELLMMKKHIAEKVGRDYVGKTILSRDGKAKGLITGVSSRYCAACGFNHPCYLVTWDDGAKTKPCTKGVKYAPGGTLQIG